MVARCVAYNPTHYRALVDISHDRRFIIRKLAGADGHAAGLRIWVGWIMADGAHPTM